MPAPSGSLLVNVQERVGVSGRPQLVQVQGTLSGSNVDSGSWGHCHGALQRQGSFLNSQILLQGWAHSGPSVWDHQDLAGLVAHRR